MVSVPYIRYLFLNDRFEQIAKTLTAGTAPANSDYQARLLSVRSSHLAFQVLPRLATLDAAELFPRGAPPSCPGVLLRWGRRRAGPGTQKCQAAQRHTHGRSGFVEWSWRQFSCSIFRSRWVCCTRISDCC